MTTTATSTHSAIFRDWRFNAPVVGMAINGRGSHIALATGDGAMWFLPASDEAERPKELMVHKGISLSLVADSDDHAFLSGGDDGRVLIIDPDLDAPTPVAEHKGQWIDHVAAGGKHRAYSLGKKLNLVEDDGTVRPLATLPSSIGGLAFSPNGKRVAASHYNGLSLYWTQAKNSEATRFEWKGSHLGVIWHPDGKAVLTSLQDNSLHGWTLPDGKEMQMQGYSHKVGSMAFTARGKCLATSGAEQIICWPFTGGGPWGKPPLVLGGLDNRRVTTVAPHPKDDLVAAGYHDGMIVLAPLDGRMEIMLHPPFESEGSAVVSMLWNKDGTCLFVAQENGHLMLFTVDSVHKAVVHAAR